MSSFKLLSDFKPTGDQPSAIAALVEGLKRGYRHQTLLGATGTGKSLDGDEPILIFEQDERGSFSPRVLTIGTLIEEELSNDQALHCDPNGTLVSYSSSRPRFVLSFNPSNSKVELKPITAYIRHRAPEKMYRITTDCGRQVLLTGDHNLYVLRGCRLQLVKTNRVRRTDYIPLPLSLPEPFHPLSNIDVLSILKEERLFIEGIHSLKAAIKSIGVLPIAKSLSKHYAAPYAKVYAVRRDLRGKRIRIAAFKDLLDQTGNLGGHWNPRRAKVVSKLDRDALPAELIINDDFLRLLGYYLAEGNKQKSYIILANSSDKIREEIETAIRGLGIPFSLRPSGEHQISSTPLALLLSNICGSKSCVKKLPYFWPQLSNEQLGTLLKAYFDGDGGVERAGAVTCITASPRLASDLLYALMRFGIWARVRKVWKRATNSDHKGGWYWLVTISGQRNLQAFAEKIGFGLLNKTNALKEKLKHHAHSNVDLIPGCGLDLKRLREGLGLSKKRLAKMAGLSRSAIYLFEIGKRNPRRETVEKLLRVFEEAAAHREITTELKELLSNLRNLLSCRWTKVKEVEAIPYNKPFVYDVSVADNETFLSGFGGMFVHNTYVMANIIEKWQRPTLVICHNKTLAAQLYSEFREFFPLNAVEYFVSYYDFYQPEAYVPEYDLYIEKDASINEEIDRLRLAATSSLMSRRDVIIVASVSCIYGIGSPEDYGRVVVNLRKGEVRKRNKVLRHLVDIYYERNDFDFARGRFRVRGDTLEVFPAYGETAYRIEFWGDEIERITEVNPLTGEVLSERMSIAIYPAKLFVTPQEKLELALRDIEAELEERLKELHSQGKLLEAQRLEQRTRYDLEMLREIGYCPGVENYSRHLSRRKPGEPPWTLLDYFPDDFLMFIDESHMTIPQLHGMYRGDRSRKETLVEYGFRLPSALDNRPLKFEEFESRINQVIYTSATPGPYELKHSTQVVEQIIRPTGLVDPEVIVKPTEGQIDDLLWQIDQRVNKGERVLVTTLTKRMAEDLADYLEEMGVKVHYLHSEIQTIERVEILRDLRLGVYDVVVGINLLREGLDLPEVSLVAILDADKEGFLRSETALIQTIGRAARHINGQVIMYADTITKSMQRAIEETNRRRRIQMEYNEKHGIEPKSIVKEIHDLTDRVRRMREERATYRFELPKHEVKRLIEDLEKQMKEAASRLEFEKAAMLRDKIFELKKMELSSGEFFNRSQEDLR